MESPEMAATASGRNSGSSTVSAASATNNPLAVIESKKLGPPPASGPEVSFTTTAISTGTEASTAIPNQLRRRPKISTSSERKNRMPGIRGRRGAASGATGATGTSTADIEALPGQRDEHVLQVRPHAAEAADRHTGVHQGGHQRLRFRAPEQRLDLAGGGG